MKKLWDNITASDVKKAIEIFDKTQENYPEPRNTFLIFNEKKYPAKHIRGLAYYVANKKEISKSEYSGGQETANFFKKLGFSVQYKKETLKPTETLRQISKPTKQIEPQKMTSKKLIVVSEKNAIQCGNHKIARLVVTGKQYDKYGNPNFTKLEKLIEKFLSTEFGKNHFEFILTPGGFLTFEFPAELQRDLDISKAEKQNIPQLQKAANNVITDFFGGLQSTVFKKLKETADFFTIGIDGFNPTNDQSIELVAVYDLGKEKVTNWTGKFYPTEGQKKNLIKINNLDTHFIELNNQKIVILGCHDLNVFSPRGQAAANPNGWKKQLADKFKVYCKEFNPEIILQHPHWTDTPNIWNSAWRTVEKELPNVKHFASGIKYYNNRNGVVRGDIDKVLEKTKKGDVIDFYYD
jgi:hypothetical protein